MRSIVECADRGKPDCQSVVYHQTDSKVYKAHYLGTKVLASDFWHRADNSQIAQFLGLVAQMEDGRPTGAALRFEGSAQQRRGRADTWSKIAFQYYARRAPLSFQELSGALRA